MAFANLMNPGCGCCGDAPPDTCPMTVLLRSCGAPVSGAVIKVGSVSEGIATAGATDGSGRFTFPAAYPFASFWIEYDGIASDTFPIQPDSLDNCSEVFEVCYDHAKVNASATQAATFSEEEAAPFTIASSTPTSAVFVFREFRYCSDSSLLPLTIVIHATPDDPDNYLDNCVTLTLDCGDETSASLTLFRWSDDYGAHDTFCDSGCALAGAGPNFRGLLAKRIYITWTATDSETGGDLTSYVFGSLGGVPIPLDYDDSGLGSGAGWGSGCIPAEIPCNPNDTESAAYHSVSTGILLAPPDPVYVSFLPFETTDCTVPPVRSAVCDPPFQIVILTQDYCKLTSPVNDDNGIYNPAKGIIYNYHLSE